MCDDIHFSGGDDPKRPLSVPFKYEQLPVDQVMNLMMDEINKIQTILSDDSIGTSQLRMLLNHFKWDQEKFLNKFFEKRLSDLLDEAKIIDPQTYNGGLPSDLGSSGGCGVCMDEDIKPTDLFFVRPCAHSFCFDCLAQYVSTKVMSDGQADLIGCPASECKLILDDEVVLASICESNDPQLLPKYQRLLTNRFVELNRQMRWCPSANCPMVVKVEFPDTDPILCDECLLAFCFKCGEKWHEPVPCNQLKKFYDFDDKSYQWITTNTKECPNCKWGIEKNQGCNHMQCTKCRTHFCWVCLTMGPNIGQGTHNCNSTGVKTHSDNIFSGVKRYQIFLQRIKTHEESYTFETTQRKNISKMLKSMEGNIDDRSLEIIRDALKELVLCRLLVTSSYLFSFYHKENSQMQIYQENQKDLEFATERLSHILGQEISFDDVTQIEEKSSYCKRRRNILLEHVEEGENEQWWLEIEP